MNNTQDQNQDQDSKAIDEVAHIGQVAEMQRRLSLRTPSGIAHFFTMFDGVHQFMNLSKEATFSYKGKISDGTIPMKVLLGKMDFINEEVNKELMTVLDKVASNNGAVTTEQKVEILDGIVDSVIVLMGLAANLGLPFDHAFALIHNANMAKIPLTGPIVNEAGKVMKPKGWVAPNMKIYEMIQDLILRETAKDEHQK